MTSKSGPVPPGEALGPVEALLVGHDRIRHFTTVALRLARSAQASPRLITDSASALRRYFGVAFPIHERNEEDCVIPRILEMQPGRAIEHALSRMAGDHRAIEDTLVTLDGLWARVLARPADLSTLGEALHARCRELASLMESHLQLEEEVVFPAVQTLPERTRKAILTEFGEQRSSGTIPIGRHDPRSPR
jgi:iron-sulfur cluster repair protein YtfE (RIC family)